MNSSLDVAPSSGVVTAPLVSRNRKFYRDEYRMRAFVESPSAAPRRAVRGRRVTYGCQFVNAETGQATEIAEIGLMRIGP